VTAAIISLALDIAGAKETALYDGSWSEWARARMRRWKQAAMTRPKDNRPRELPAIVTYLGMEARPKAPPPPPPLLRTALLKCEHPPVHFYRYLYDTVGQPYFWAERRLGATKS